MYQQMLAAGEYNSAAEYDTLHALAKAEYEEEQAREDAALEYAMEEERMNNATEKQKAAVERLRKRCGDDMLLRRAKVGKWSEHEFDLDNLTKDEAQRIITTAPSKPIYGIHAPISMVQSL